MSDKRGINYLEATKQKNAEREILEQLHQNIQAENVALVKKDNHFFSLDIKHDQNGIANIFLCKQEIGYLLIHCYPISEENEDFAMMIKDIADRTGAKS